MCFQGYAHFLCGHVSTHEELCYHAREIDVPFWLKIQCPNYDIVVRDPSQYCGIGKFYCARTMDGQYLDKVCRTQQMCEQRIALIDRLFAEKYAPIRANILMRLASDANHNRARLLQALSKDPEACGFSATINAVNQEKNRVAARQNNADNMMLRSRHFYERLRVEPSADAHGASFLDHLKQISKPPAPQESQLSTISLRGVVPIRPTLIPGHPAAAAVLAREQGSQSFVAPAAGPRLTVRKHQEPSNRVPLSKPKQENVDQERTETLRRSARIKDRKVSYTDCPSDASIPSRSSSPVKSEGSSFSPTKSDASFVTNGAGRKKSNRDGRHWLNAPKSTLERFMKDWTETINQSPERNQIATGKDSVPQTGTPVPSKRQTWHVNKGESDPILPTSDPVRRPVYNAYGVTTEADSQREYNSTSPGASPELGHSNSVPSADGASLYAPVRSRYEPRTPSMIGSLSPDDGGERKRSISSNSDLRSSKRIRLSFPGQDSHSPNLIFPVASQPWQPQGEFLPASSDPFRYETAFRPDEDLLASAETSDVDFASDEPAV